MKKYCKLTNLVVIFYLLCCCSCSNSNNLNYQKYKVYKKDFGSKIYSTISYECSEEEKLEVQAVIDKFENIIKYTGTKSNADMDVGELKKYYFFSDEHNYSKVEYNINLLTTKQNKNNGYIWLTYSVQHIDDNDYCVNGSNDILCYFEITKSNDKWYVKKIIEPA